MSESVSHAKKQTLEDGALDQFRCCTDADLAPAPYTCTHKKNKKKSKSFSFIGL